MSTDSRTIISRLITEAWTGANIDLVDQFVAQSYYEHAPFGDVVGIDGYKEGIAMFNASFSGISLTIEDQLSAEDRVVTRFTFRGRHAGEFFGVPTSGANVVMEGIVITKVEDGKIVEEWISLDLLGLMRQIGAIPDEEAVA